MPPNKPPTELRDTFPDGRPFPPRMLERRARHAALKVKHAEQTPKALLARLEALERRLEALERRP